MALRRPPGTGGNAMATKRIRKEISDLARENLGAITLVPNESNVFQWRATIPGPAGSPYEGGVFEVDIRIPEDYPFSPPHVQFVTKVYHCNVSQHGAICLDLLKTAWSPALSLYKVVLSLSSLLTDPNPSDPLVPAIAQEYKQNRKKHDATAKEWVKMYAQPRKETLTGVPAQSAPRAQTSRPGTILRHVNGSIAPPAQIAGTRRSAPNRGDSATPIEIGDDDDDVEIELSTPRRSKRARVENGEVNGAGSANRRGGAGASADDVIVIDDDD
ncbi:hypothetical protein CspeluHIS016_0402340 [Cutaneotrichosporon spelunceum]|uniref:UBC core domain-containing protein n=1 Tax=Cutaneotrichosporon spelunceum TaxID=1672016 RepID=A0AAD3TVS6_9TREE|nr:hypothetical protein CspeluHIS016_0402340 [Cutaneotrichosporon spelunceum]